MSPKIITILVVLLPGSALVNEGEFFSKENSSDLKVFTKNFSKLCTDLRTKGIERPDFLNRLLKVDGYLLSWFQTFDQLESGTLEDIGSYLTSVLSPSDFEYLTIGGESAIFSGKDGGREEVVKAIYPQESQGPSREFFIWLKIWNSNRNVVTEPYECALSNAVVYFIQEKMEGNLLSLAEKEIRAKPFPVSSLVDIMLKMSRCVEAVHSSGVVHYDIKLPNFLYSRQPPAGTNGKNGEVSVKITDFGASNFLKGLSNGSTILYKSPEVFIKDKGGYSSDVFSLGISFWHLVEAEEKAELTDADADEPKVVDECDLYEISWILNSMKSKRSSTDFSPIEAKMSNCHSKRVSKMKADFETVKQANAPQSQTYDSLVSLIERMTSYDAESRPAIDVVISELEALKVGQEKSTGKDSNII